MLFNKCPLHRSGHGFSLVEIMIAVVVGMLGILVIMQVFLVSEGQKRTTTGGADAQENALMALYTMEQDLRMSGLGVVGLGCTTINAYNENRIPPDYTFEAVPVKVTRDSPAAGSDTVTTLYSTSSYGNIPTTIASPMPNSSAELNVANGDGYYESELVLISQAGQPCTIVQASQDGHKTGTDWNLQHNPGGANVYNPPGGENIFPAGGYTTGAGLINMGSMVNHEYYVEDNTLKMRDKNLPSPTATNPLALVNGIIAIRAQYGSDTNADGYVDVYDNATPASAAALVTLRVAVVARSGQLEKEVVTPGNPPDRLVLWNGGTITNGGALDLSATGPLGTTAQRYRYKVYQTIIPLRNVIWNN